MYKKFTLIIILSSLFFGAYSQNAKDTLFIDEIYSNIEQNIVSQRVLEFDSIDIKDLILFFDNWGGQNYRNYSEVKTSQTENQITLKYITSSFDILDMYVQMTAEFKQNRVRITLIDDGNVYKPSSYSGGYTSPAISAHSYHIKDYFPNGNIIFKITPGALNVKEKYASGAKNYKQNLDNTITEISNFIKNSKEKKLTPLTNQIGKSPFLKYHFVIVSSN